MLNRIIVQYLIFIAASFVFISCNKKRETIEGDLYFKFIDFAVFKAPDCAVVNFEKEIWKVDTGRLNNQDKRYYILMQHMSRQKLLCKPFIRVRRDNGEIVMLFLSKSEYTQLNNIHGVIWIVKTKSTNKG